MYRAHVDLHTSENKFLHGRHGCVWPAVTDLYNTELSSVRFRSTIERSSRVWPAEFDLLNTVNSGSWTCAHSSRLHCWERDILTHRPTSVFNALQMYSQHTCPAASLKSSVALNSFHYAICHLESKINRWWNDGEEKKITIDAKKVLCRHLVTACGK